MDQTPHFRPAAAIDARATTRGLTGDIVRFRYPNRYIFGEPDARFGEPDARPKGHALYVGVGHDLDCATVAGLDPYRPAQRDKPSIMQSGETAYAR